MTEQQVNIPLLRKAVEWAEAEAAKPGWKREWNQSYWVVTPDEIADTFSVPEAECGTAYCIAGWVCVTSGYPIQDDMRTTDLTYVPIKAAALLGIAYDRSRQLFRGNNTIEDVRRIAEDIAGERL